MSALACATMLAVSAAGPAAAQAANFSIILNNAGLTGSGACLIDYELVNNTDTTFDEVQYDVVHLGADGQVLLRQILTFGWVRAGRTKFASFSTAGDDAFPCDAISSVLVNDSKACLPSGEENGDLSVCRDFSTDSRYAIPLD